MPNVPNPFEPIDVMRDRAQPYLVHIFTNLPVQATYQDPLAFVPPPEGAYQAQRVLPSRVQDQGSIVVVDLEPALFSGKQWDNTHQIRGAAYYAVYDNGKVLLAYTMFPAPILLGSKTQNLQAPYRLLAESVPATVTVSW